MVRIGCLLVLSGVLVGCQITRVEGEYRDVEVKYGSEAEVQQNRVFCPPGQAKKGRC
ncbi:hypothetical protein [Vibrio sp. JPW-9-11-11]|uniref:hypothetical protein n=1 Tax=Vibrio sp. JPW-9-11-11 TaxID=1416532 RepID=UPI0015932BFC|nr:hypothetical protein [Vibrio sp. JPW-9-11-11]